MKEYRNEKGKLHRTDGPAIEWSDGYKEYWVDGKRHRTDGPAVEGSDGYKEYWVDGKRHRLNGPAVEGSDGYKEYWVGGQWLTEQEFRNFTAEDPKEETKEDPFQRVVQFLLNSSLDFQVNTQEKTIKIL